MPEKRLQKTREINKELNCIHKFYAINDSHIAPFFTLDGQRQTIFQCIKCGFTYSKIRSDKEFKEELRKIFGLDNA